MPSPDSDSDAVRRILPDEVLRENKYTVGGIVARGGMGAIFGAHDAAIHREVAMKVMLQSRSEQDALRFIEEAQITGQLEHPGIVPIYELGVDDSGKPFYTMKMVRGLTLKKVLALLRDGVAATVEKYSLGARLTVFQKICDALAFAHSKGVIHRDLKPENIMVGEYGEVLVMDWGLAKVVGGREGSPSVPGERSEPVRAGQRAIFSVRQSESTFATDDGAIMGTPQYMSPEQARGEIDQLDARSDIYALGAILYAMLALRPPVTGANVAEVVDKVARGEVEPLECPRSGGLQPPRAIANRPSLIPASLAAVVRKAMAFAPAARYPSVTALQADLAAFQTGFATGAENAGAWKQFTLLVKRHKATTLGLAAVLLVGTVFGTKALLEGRRAEREALRANKALADLKKSAPALRQLAESEASFGRFDSALEKFDAALALAPEHLPAYWRRAWLLLGMERWSDAAEAIRDAQRRDSASASLAAILPVVEQLASAPNDAQRFKPERNTTLTRHLTEVRASGELSALSRRLQFSAQAKLDLVQKRLAPWAGKEGNPPGKITAAGLIHVGSLPKEVENLELLRGLPIDSLWVPAKVTSLDPLRGMRLQELGISHTKITDLSPLRGMPLRVLNAAWSEISDLSPLAGAPLEELSAEHAEKIVDLSPLKGAPLRIVNVVLSKVSDLGPLTGAPLEELMITGTPVSDLTALRGKPLRVLKAGVSATVRRLDLEPLRGLPIVELEVGRGHPEAPLEVSPLLDLPKLEKLKLRSNVRNLSSLRQHPAVKYIAFIGTAYKPVAEFWTEYDAEQAAGKK